MSFEQEELLENVKRQSKRLSKLISCPLGHARELLSIVVYNCDSYSHLLASLKSNSFDNERLALTALSPHSDLFLMKLLQTHTPDILENFENKSPDSHLTEEDLVSIFGLSFDQYHSMISN